jgi:amino acid transporter
MEKNAKLDRNLTLFDVYAMSTGAMFSSGLFLLPGIAAASTGNSVFLAYLLAGLLILPAMYAMAELSTAMPKAGGTYYFLDRAMGPLMGTIGGLGSWVAVVFKSAFALVGMGAYLSLYLNLPFKVTAIILAIAFGAINIFGAKETTQLQRILVTTLVVILIGFTLLGLKFASAGPEPLLELNPEYGPFFSSGLIGLVSTIGLVFVSYAGLTKVASVAEEVQNPDRNIPLGMTLSLLTATVLYTLGTFVLVKIMPSEELYASLTPIADAGRYFMGNWPMDIGVILIVVAAIAAFASTGNAGIMSASRYPYAMAKDRLVPDGLAQLGKYKTPTISIVLTVGVMIAVILAFNVESVAKLASAFQLLLFMLVCAAVIVMRESGISTYKPGFKTPLYPWMPIAGILIGFWLIIEMGILAIGFTGTIVIGCVLWYNFYASSRVERRGAIFHVHERLGRNVYEGLEHELMSIIHDRTQAQNLSYEAVIARSVVTDFRYGRYDRELLGDMLREVAVERHGVEPEVAAEIASASMQFRPLSEGIQYTSKLDKRLESPELYIFRFGPKAKVELDVPNDAGLHTIIILACPPKPAGLDMRIAGHLAEIIGGEGFENRWLEATSEAELNDVLVRDDHFLHLNVEDVALLSGQLGRPLSEVELPDQVNIVLIERGAEMLYANPSLTLQAGDIVAIIGEPEALTDLQAKSQKPS